MRLLQRSSDSRHSASLPVFASQPLLHVLPSSSRLGQLLALSCDELHPMYSQLAWLRWAASLAPAPTVELLAPMKLIASLPLTWLPLPSLWTSPFPYLLHKVVELQVSWYQPLPQLLPFFLPLLPLGADHSDAVSLPIIRLSGLSISHMSLLCPTALLRPASEPEELLFAVSAVRRSPLSSSISTSARSSLVQSAFAAP